ncbi:MAG TPA: hypothetical protein VFJ72_16025 [Rubrobacteraceae bacterium]|nr:hypothetical protein [Rubrobacteraceae bacterium]
MQGSWDGFDVFRERQRELLRETEGRRFVRDALPRRNWRERLSHISGFLVGIVSKSAHDRRPDEGEDFRVTDSGVPDAVYVIREASGAPCFVVEVFRGRTGRVLRRTDLETGASSYSFLAGRTDGR